MNKTILISSIFRNSEKKLSRYHEQLKTLVLGFPDIKFLLSIYENDSSDNTKDILHSLDWSFVSEKSIVTENIGTNFYGSVVDEQRVKNLAGARNKTLDIGDFLNKSNYVLSIESDIQYDLECAQRIINFESDYGVEADIVSAVSCKPSKYDRKRLYDLWGTRRTPDEEWGSIDNGTDYKEYYATYNCFCFYKSAPIKKGAKFGWYNNRLKKFDCDTMVICENFRDIGHNKIYINHLANCWHI
jgi:hypothetical protein